MPAGDRPVHGARRSPAGVTVTDQEEARRYVKPFDRRLEAGFEERQCERALPLLRVAACLGAVLFLLFLGWDTLVDPTRVVR